MTTWHIASLNGTPVTFTYNADERGNVNLTVQEVEGLMRQGGWRPGKPEPVKPFHERIIDYYARIGALPAASWETPEDLGRMSIEAHQRKMKEAE